jgi:serine phosphatase RsbU (regulator of sigma subunit)/anti-sigma regulatory factor (Ser/Thr protein kinase)
VHELVLAGGAEAVPRARRFVASALSDAAETQRDDAELVATELVTNAILHGSPPVTVRVDHSTDVVRVEVEDSGRALPIRLQADGGAMTGRGLGLVAALAQSWGIEPAPGGGKRVWADLCAGGTEADVAGEWDVDALLDAFPDEPEPVRTYEVELGAVPTDLLLEAKAHVDNLVREFTLASSSALPPEVRALVDTVLHDFADARRQIKQQAAAAAAAGEQQTSLRLTLAASAVDAGERYLEALDEADRYARAARLLTLETPPVHRVFRRWYVQALIDQLRHAAAGAPAPPVRTFAQRLADEVTLLAPLRDVAGRLELLQRVTADLTGAATVEQIVDLVCSSAYGVLGATSARIYLLTSEGTLRSYATAGGDPVIAARYDEFDAAADLPGGVVLRTRQPLVLRGSEEIATRFPALAGVYAEERTLLVAPLAVGDHDLGVLSLSFLGQDAIDDATQQAFLVTLADVAAQALERALAASAAAEASERLAFLAEASVLLSSSLDSRTVLAQVAQLVVPRFADWCAIQLVENSELETVALTHVDPAKVAWAQEASAQYPADMSAETGAPNVIRTGRSELYPYIPWEMIEAAAIDADHLELLRQFGFTSALVVPLAGRSGVIGALTLIYSESGRRYTDADVVFMEDVARRAGLAVEAAHLFEQQSGRLQTVQRVAEAAQHAILATLPATLGPVSLSARYVSATAEALVGGDLYEVVERPDAVRLLVGDVRGKGLEAVRLATIVLGEFRAAAADIDALPDVAVKIDERLRRYLGDEDFVTAVLAEIGHDGSFALVHCGHPPALIASGGVVTEATGEPTLPLGLGAAPHLVTGSLAAGDRVLLYTDGIIEARDRDRRFVDLGGLTTPMLDRSLDEVLDGILASLRSAVGGALGDDLALVLAQYDGSEPRPRVAAGAPEDR